MNAPAHNNRIVLAYSGGLDTSIIIPWLTERGWEVHCLAGDVGQGPEELVGLEEKAAATGAASCKVADLRHAFVTETIFPALRALAIYESKYLLGTALARPVLARAQVEYAREVDASNGGMDDLTTADVDVPPGVADPAGVVTVEAVVQTGDRVSWAVASVDREGHGSVARQGQVVWHDCRGHEWAVDSVKSKLRPRKHSRRGVGGSTTHQDNREGKGAAKVRR